MGGLLGGKSPSPPPPPPKWEDTPEGKKWLEQQRQIEERRARRAKGRQSTILTSGRGVLDDTTQIGQKRLLGR